MVIIDAYNLLHATKTLPGQLAGLDLEGLLGLITNSRFGDQSVWLVCDGGSAPANWPKARRSAESPQMPNIRMVYAGHGQEADAAIERILAERPRLGKDQRALLVVSSDRRVRHAATTHGFDSIRSEAFLARLAADQQREADRTRQAEAAAQPPLDAIEARAWARQFRADAPDVAKLVAEADRALQAMKRDAEARRKDNQPTTQPLVKLKNTPVQAARRAIERADPAAPGGVGEDPVLRALLDDCGDGVNMDDLDMTKWLTKPLKQPPAPRSPPPR